MNIKRNTSNVFNINDLNDSIQSVLMDDAVVSLQKIWRGYILRRKNMPLVLRYIQNYLSANPIEISSITRDGRVNSSIDENTIIDKLALKYAERMHVSEARMWYDILLFDFVFGWIPVNIKTSTMNSSDNSGNLAMCLYAYTDANMQLEKPYKNGNVSSTLFDHIMNKSLNRKFNRDYYFLVINKTKSSDVIINSIRGLSSLVHNANNIPFQIRWKHNRHYQYKNSTEALKQFVVCLQKNKMTWKAQFIANIQSIDHKFFK